MNNRLQPAHALRRTAHVHRPLQVIRKYECREPSVAFILLIGKDLGNWSKDCYFYYLLSCVYRVGVATLPFHKYEE